MDTDLLKTFLEVKNTRHFGRSAENLYLTQAAVSARIKQLENLFGATLFTRYRNNLQLTPTGERLVPHAEAILIALERAKQDVALKQEQKFVITIGGTTGLWDLCLQDALSEIYAQLENISVRSEAHSQDVLIRRLLERTMDIALMYEPAKTTDLQSLEVSPAELVLVSNQKDQTPDEAMNGHYVAVDWGMSFDIAYAKFFQGAQPPLMHTTLAKIGLDFILSKGGSAYLPYRLVENDLGSRLHLVKDAPIIQRPIFVVYHKENRHSDIIDAINKIIVQQVTPGETCSNEHNSTVHVL